MERINVNVSDLCLWETNPRVEPSIDQMDELNKIYNFSAQSQSTSKRQLMNLASSIAENGYQNDVEPILATRAGDKYVIHDAIGDCLQSNCCKTQIVTVNFLMTEITRD